MLRCDRMAALSRSRRATAIKIKVYQLSRLGEGYSRHLAIRACLDQPKLDNIKPYPYSVNNQRAYLIEKVFKDGRVNFIDLLKESGNRILVVFNFLAILELIQLGDIQLEINEEPNFNEFFLVKGTPSGLN